MYSQIVVIGINDQRKTNTGYRDVELADGFI